MFTFAAIKLLFSRALSFILAHWQAFLFIAICLYAYYENNAYNRVKNELVEYKQQVAKVQADALAESTIKQAQVKSQYDVADYIAKNQINAITQKKTIAQITKSIKDTYEANSAKSNMVRNSDLMRTPASSSQPATQASSNQQGLATSESIAEPTCSGLRAEKEQLEAKLNDLELVTAIETVHFNHCRAGLNADTAMYGRED